MTDDADQPAERTYRVPGAILTEREHVVPLDHAEPDGPTITVFTREVAAPDGTDRPYLVFLQGGPGFEAARPTSPPTGWMKRALARLPRPAARPARDRAVDAGRVGDPRRHARGAGRVPDPLPRRLDRPRRGVDPGGARRRALERPRPELRRLHLDDLPVDRARRPARGAPHRRAGADRPPGRRHLRRDLPAADQGQPALLRALPGRPGARPRDPPPARRRGRPPAVGRPADRATLPPARACGWATAPASSCSTTSSSCRSGRSPSSTTPRHGVAVQPQPDLRDAPRVVVRRRRRHALVGRPAAPRRGARRGVLHGRARLPVDVGGLRRAPAAAGRRRDPGASTRGRRSTTPTSSGGTRSRSRRRSTSTTCTSSATSPRRRPPTIRGLRPWETDEFEHNGLRADGERVLGRLIDLVRGRV